MKNKFRTLMVFLFVILLAGCGGKEEAEIVNEAENMENSGAVAEEPARQIIFTGQDIEGNEISSDIFQNQSLLWLMCGQLTVIPA